MGESSAIYCELPNHWTILLTLKIKIMAFDCANGEISRPAELLERAKEPNSYRECDWIG